MKTYTDKQLQRMYLNIEPSPCDDWPSCFKDMRAVLAAKTFQEAVAILTKADWGSPVVFAREIRGTKQKTCPTCCGAGVVER